MDSLLPAPAPPISDKAITVPAEMVLQIAAGMEEPFAIASRFGFTSDEFAALAQWEPFRKQVDAKKAELVENGTTFRLQMQFMAEDLGKDIYVIAKSNEVTLPQKLDTFRTFAKLADLEPKPNAQQVAAGSGFAINIILGNDAHPPVNKPRPEVIDVSPTDDGPDSTDSNRLPAAAEPAGIPAE